MSEQNEQVELLDHKFKKSQTHGICKCGALKSEHKTTKK